MVWNNEKNPVKLYESYNTTHVVKKSFIYDTILKSSMVWLMSTDSMKIMSQSFRLIITNILHFSLQMLVYSINKLNWAKMTVPSEIFYVMVIIPHISMNGKIWHTMKLSTFVFNEILLLVSTFSNKNLIFNYLSFIWLTRRIFVLCKNPGWGNHLDRLRKN